MLGDEEGMASCSKVILYKGLEFKFRLRCARALRVAGSIEPGAALLASVQNAKTLADTAAHCQALGIIGDVDALEALLAIATDPAKMPLQRGFAVIALGLLCDPAPIPWHREYSTDVNYRAKTDALAEILDHL